MTDDRPPRRLVLLRHGRTAWNHTRRAQGHADVPLDEVGHAQAQAAAPYLAAMRPARLWSSDLAAVRSGRVWSSELARAAQPAERVEAAGGLEVAYGARLGEFSVGERTGMPWDEAVKEFPQIADGVGLGERLRGVPGAETDADVTARIVPAVEDCAAALAPGETGIGGTHGAALKLALGGLVGWDESAGRVLAVLDNCHWTTVLVPADGGPRRLLDYGMGDFASSPAMG
jgi:probable phosphoglycerate mutase